MPISLKDIASNFHKPKSMSLNEVYGEILKYSYAEIFFEILLLQANAAPPIVDNTLVRGFRMKYGFNGFQIHQISNLWDFFMDLERFLVTFQNP